MEPTPTPDLDRRDAARRRWVLRGLVAALVILLASPLLTLLPKFTPGSGATPNGSAQPQPPATIHSVSVDFGLVTDPDTDWTAVNARLDQVSVNAVNLDAGRVEFTAFDWPAHPDAAAEPGTDHLAVAAAAVRAGADGTQRQIGLIVDAYVPRWIKRDPSIAGVDSAGKRSVYTASVSSLIDGEVGRRLVAYVVALGERYDPARIEVTELFLSSFTFGADDLALFRSTTGAEDWPRKADGRIDAGNAAIGTWRSRMLGELMARIRAALDSVRGGEGRQIGLVLDVRVNWADPVASRPLSGPDYSILLDAGTDLQLWVYPGRDDQPATAVEPLTAKLKAGGLPMDRLILSVGLWKGKPNQDPRGRIMPDELAEAVTGAESNGIRDVNVTPYSLLTAEHWAALAERWS